MILSSSGIREALKSGKIVIRPIEPNQIQPASIDLRLSDEFLIVDHKNTPMLDMDSKAQYKEIKAKEIIIPPKDFVLARTMEYMEIPDDHTAFLEGRSSIGRLGLFIENAGWVDPGFKGTITLELFNANNVPIKIRAGRRVCQLVISRLDKPADTIYNGKYQGQINVTASRVHLDEESLSEAMDEKDY